MNVRSLSGSRIALALLCLTALLVATTPTTGNAAGEKQLRRVRGTIGYQTTAAAPFAPVFGRFNLPDDAFAVTQAASAAELAMPDSSLVGLGENTRVQVGAFDNAASGPGSTITLAGGTLRFEIRRPAGGRANYQFVTPTSQIAVRGTVGLLSVLGTNTTVACLECAADSVVVTTGGQTFALATGQALTIGAGGVATGTITPSMLQTFGSSGVGTGSGFTGAAAGGAGAGGIAAGVVAAGVIAGVAVSNATKSSPAPGPSTTPTATPTASPSPTPSPAPTTTPTPIPTPTVTPVPSPSPSISGSIGITTRRIAPAAEPRGTPPAGPAGLSKRGGL